MVLLGENILKVHLDRLDRGQTAWWGYELIDYKIGKHGDIGKEEEDLQLTIDYLALQSRFRIKLPDLPTIFLKIAKGKVPREPKSKFSRDL